MTAAGSVPTGLRLDIFACPACSGPVEDQGGVLACGRCMTRFVTDDGEVDFAPPDGAATTFAPLRLQDPLIASRYESTSRPAFFRIMGGNWAGALTERDEVAYLQDRIRGVDGPILDLACGAGHWTKAIVDVSGVENVIGLDLSAPLLSLCRTANPGLLALRGSALALPFRTGSLGAVTCWNSLQQMRTPALVISEVGRCLRPGGVFVALTYRPADHPLARYFQRNHEAAFGVSSFPVEIFRTWLTDAGFDVLDLGGPGTFLLVTAVRRAQRS